MRSPSNSTGGGTRTVIWTLDDGGGSNNFSVPQVDGEHFGGPARR